MALLSSGLSIFEPLRSIAAASITANYVGVGVSFANPIRMFSFINTTAVNLVVSFNGIDDHIISPAETARIFDICTNRANQAGSLEQSTGTRVYVKAETGLPGAGQFYVEAMYAAENAGGR